MSKMKRELQIVEDSREEIDQFLENNKEYLQYLSSSSFSLRKYSEDSKYAIQQLEEVSLLNRESAGLSTESAYPIYYPSPYAFLGTLTYVDILMNEELQEAMNKKEVNMNINASDACEIASENTDEDSTKNANVNVYTPTVKDHMTSIQPTLVPGHP